jgi:hypothetical protein
VQTVRVVVPVLLLEFKGGGHNGAQLVMSLGSVQGTTSKSEEEPRDQFWGMRLNSALHHPGCLSVPRELLFDQ